jgi:aspartate/methionine/tyrosine aminotransferase
VFSSRLSWDLHPNPLSVLLEQKRAQSASILDLTESNPTRAGFTYPQEEILDALADPGASQYHPSPQGALSAREAVASFYAQRGSVIHPDQILLTASTSEAYAYLFKLLCDPDNEILTPCPSYPLFEFLAALESVRVRQYPLRYDGAWRIDFAALESAITDRTRAIVIVNPNNPTGSFLAPDERVRLQSLAASRGLAILIDEVFLDYRFDLPPNRNPIRDTSRDQRERLKEILPRDQIEQTPPESTEPASLIHSHQTSRDRLAPARSQLTQQRTRERLKEILPRDQSEPTPAHPAPITPPQALTFHMSGLSKIAGLPQMKLGWIVADGPGHPLALDRLELIADTYLSVSTPVQLALPRLLRASESIRSQILDRARSNLATLRSLTDGTACHVLNLEGGWHATLQVPQTRSEEEWALTLLADHNVLIQPGFFFDFETEAFLIVSLITPPEIFAEGIRRIISLAP